MGPELPAYLIRTAVGDGGGGVSGGGGLGIGVIGGAGGDVGGGEGGGLIPEMSIKLPPLSPMKGRSVAEAVKSPASGVGA